MTLQIEKLFVICGPSGVGKTSIVDGLLMHGLPVAKVITTTTRDEIRPGEQQGKDYHFVSESEFNSLVEQGEIFEWNDFAGHKYGTQKKDLESILAEDKIPLWVIDPATALEFKKLWPQSVVIFIAPESLSVLQERLQNRGEDPEDIKARIQLAEEEMKISPNFDYQVINLEGELSQTIAEVADIIEQEL